MYISLDLETTGIDPEKDKIIEFGAVKFDLSGHKETLSFLINPGLTLPQIITHITKITDNDLKGQPLITEKLQEIKDFIGDCPIIGHNIQFDTSFLKNNGINLTNNEYDTCNLSSILLPNLPSYSLEILTHKLNLQHAEKHRALDDAIAAMELFIKLIDLFQELPEETILEIKEIATKSNWKMKDLILSLNPTNKPIKKGKAKDKAPKESSTSAAIKTIADTIQAENSSTLFEITPPFRELAEELLKTSDNSTYICVTNDLFNELSESLPEHIASLDSPKNYISLKRLDNLKNKPSFEEHEATALIKYLIWSRQTNTGLLKELNLLGPEKSTIYQVNADPDFVDPNSEPFIKKALEKGQNSPTLCTHYYLLENSPEKIENLIMIDLEKFSKDLFFHNSEYLTIERILRPLQAIKELYPENQTVETLISKCTILFGLFGLFYKNYNNLDSYNPRAMVTSRVIPSPEWKDFLDSLNNMVSISQELGEINDENTIGHLQKWKQILKTLEETFKNPDLETNLIFIEQNYHQEIAMSKTPKSLDESFSKILANCQTFKIIDECLDIADEGTFVKKLYGFEDGIKIVKTASKREDLTISISKSEDNQLQKIIDIIKEKHGNLAFLFNSRQQLEFYTLKLSKLLQETDINLVSQLVGSIAKTEEKFNQDPENSILLLTSTVWQEFRYNEQIKTLLIQKIPFEAPGNIVLTSLSFDLKNSFADLQIPRATIATKKILNRLTSKNTEVIFLDTRLFEKDYCKPILDTLNNLGQVQMI